MKLATIFSGIIIVFGTPAVAMTEREAQQEYCRVGGEISELMVQFAAQNPLDNILRAVLYEHYNMGGKVELDTIVSGIKQAAEELTPAQANDAFRESCLEG